MQTTRDVVEEQVTIETLLTRVEEFKAKDARFMTISVMDHGEDVKLIYHFDDGMDVSNISLITPKDQPIQSISGVYLVAFIAENEAADLFKVKFKDLALDLGGKMLKVETSESTLLKPAVGPQPTIKRFFGKCREDCPAMVNIPRYIRQIAEGDSEAAYNTITDRAPLPAILGRVCFAPCQEGCRQELEAKPIQVRLLKRYAADTVKEKNGGYQRDVLRKESTGKRVAVVGGGPSGVSTAYFLGMLGHDVTVYEKRDKVGGAMLWGIPKFRLPKDVLSEEMMARLAEAGAKLETGIEIDNLDNLLTEGYDAVYVAIGSEKCNRMRCEGEDSEGVISFDEFLEAVNVRNETPDVGKNVIVIGGGNSAIDSARTAKRLGAEVTLYYRRTEDEMPALLEEIHGAMQEGISFEFLSSQVTVHPGKPLRVEFQWMIPGEPDESGRRRPVPMEGRSVFREADTIIKAIGTTVDVPEGYGLDVDQRGRIVVGEDYATSKKGVYAGGDAVFGASSVIQAIRDARKAASAIDQSFGGGGLPEPTIDMDELVNRPINRDELIEIEQAECECLSNFERMSTFNEVEMGIIADKAVREATRCWRCDWNE
ncbi:MAG: FAD-dependent oxidoreductase [Candidatus Bathyarchaeota archaeon]|nr:FAD-dependent oxidoreductase [Candidatus Bathyarchaeota archaeon]